MKNKVGWLVDVGCSWLKTSSRGKNYQPLRRRKGRCCTGSCI